MTEAKQKKYSAFDLLLGFNFQNYFNHENVIDSTVQKIYANNNKHLPTDEKM